MKKTETKSRCAVTNAADNTKYEKVLRICMEKTFRGLSKNDSSEQRKLFKNIASSEGLNDAEAAEVGNLAVDYWYDIKPQLTAKAEERYANAVTPTNYRLISEYVSELEEIIVSRVLIALPYDANKTEILNTFIRNGRHVAEAQEMADFVYDFIGETIDYIKEAISKRSYATEK